MRIFNEDDKVTSIEFVMEMGGRGLSSVPGPAGPPGQGADPQTVLISQAADINMTGAVIGNFLRWNGSGFSVSYVTLEDMLDVVMGTPQVGESIIFDGTNWTNSLATGTPGTGTIIWDGAGVPAGATGTEDSYYLDTVSHILYGPKSGTTWPVAIPLVPAGGTNGQLLAKSSDSDYVTTWIDPPPLTPSGTSIRTGFGPPNVNTGSSGDYYVDSGTQIFYGPKNAIYLGQRTYSGATAPLDGQWSSPQSPWNHEINIKGIDGLDYSAAMETYIKEGHYIQITVPGKNIFTGHIDSVERPDGQSLGLGPDIGEDKTIRFSTDTYPLPGFWTVGDVGTINVRGVTNEQEYWPIISPGTVIHNGTVDPWSHLGRPGDFYLNGAAGILYGPKKDPEEDPPIWPVALQGATPAPPPGTVPTTDKAVTGLSFRSTTLACPGGAWTNVASTVGSNMPAGKYYISGVLFGYSNANVGGSIRIETPEGASFWSPLYSPSDSLSRVLSVIHYIYTKPTTGNLTLNLAVNPTVNGLTAAISTHLSWLYVGK